MLLLTRLGWMFLVSCACIQAAPVKKKGFFEELNSGTEIYVALGIAVFILLVLVAFGLVKLRSYQQQQKTSSTTTTTKTNSVGKKIKKDLSSGTKKDEPKVILEYNHHKVNGAGIHPKPLVDLTDVHIPNSAKPKKHKKVTLAVKKDERDNNNERRRSFDRSRRKGEYASSKEDHLSYQKRSKSESRQVPNHCTLQHPKPLKLIDFAGNNGNKISNHLIDFSNNVHKLKHGK